MINNKNITKKGREKMAYLIGLLILSLCMYIFVSINIKAYINGILYRFANVVIFICILPIIYEIASNQKFDYKYIFIYYGTSFIFFSIGYLISMRFLPKVKISFECSKRKQIKLRRIILILIIFIIITIISKMGFSIFSNPRYFYEQTRVGYGYLTFILVALLNLYLILTLFIDESKFKIALVFFIGFFTGSKANMISPVCILIFYYFYCKNKDRYNIFKLVKIGLLVTSIIVVIFYLTSEYLQGQGFLNVILGLSGYSDYVRNFSILVGQIGNHFFNGLITFENNVYSILPRILYPSKPEIFGLFRISYMFFPEQTMLMKGAPSFGEFGSIYADFGGYSIVIIMILYFLKGLILASIEKSFLHNKNIITFMLFLNFMGIPLINTGIQAIVMSLINVILIICIIPFVRKKYN